MRALSQFVNNALLDSVGQKMDLKMSVFKKYGKLFEKTCIRPITTLVSPWLGKPAYKKRDPATDAAHELSIAIVREQVRKKKISPQEMDVSINSCLTQICKQNQDKIFKDFLPQFLEN